MPKINLYCAKQTSATSISNIFIDEYMAKANGEFVKIYLYLLRQLNSSNAEFSISEIADKFEHTEKDVKRALCYWERMHLLHLDYDEAENLIGIQLLDVISKEQEEKPLPPPLEMPISSSASNYSKTVPKKDSYSQDAIQNFAEQEHIQAHNEKPRSQDP